MALQDAAHFAAALKLDVNRLVDVFPQVGDNVAPALISVHPLVVANRVVPNRRVLPRWCPAAADLAKSSDFGSDLWYQTRQNGQNGHFAVVAPGGKVRRAFRGARVDEHIRAGYHADASAREAARRRTRPADARSVWVSFSQPVLPRRPPAAK